MVMNKAAVDDMFCMAQDNLKKKSRNVYLKLRVTYLYMNGISLGLKPMNL